MHGDLGNHSCYFNFKALNVQRDNNTIYIYILMILTNLDLFNVLPRDLRLYVFFSTNKFNTKLSFILFIVSSILRWIGIVLVRLCFKCNFQILYCIYPATKFLIIINIIIKKIFYSQSLFWYQFWIHQTQNFHILNFYFFYVGAVFKVK